jgi:ring-1,2-phenylacetyl-CoA epoxidase subunit PaaE
MVQGFHPLRVAEVRRETPDAVSIRFDLPSELRDVFAFKAGQHLTLRTLLQGEDIRRNYSVCVAPHEGELRIAVKQIVGGAFSGWINTAVQPGAVIEVMPPHGSFTWTFDPVAERRYVGFAGGSGITPVLSILKAALAREPRGRFTLLYGNRTAAQVMFLEELAALKNRYLDRLEVFHFLEEEEEEIDLFNGRLDAAKIEQVLDSLIRAEDVDAFFICGPGPMMDAVEAGLKACGVAGDKILLERYLTGAISAAQAAAAQALVAKARGLRVSVVLEGRKSSVVFNADSQSVLDAARAAGLPAPYACKGGVCATCRAKLVSGTVEMKVNYGLSASELAQGYVLTCQAAPTSAGVVLDYDA